MMNHSKKSSTTLLHCPRKSVQLICKTSWVIRHRPLTLSPPSTHVEQRSSKLNLPPLTTAYLDRPDRHRRNPNLPFIAQARSGGQRVTEMLQEDIISLPVTQTMHNQESALQPQLYQTHFHYLSSQRHFSHHNLLKMYGRSQSPHLAMRRHVRKNCLLQQLEV